MPDFKRAAQSRAQKPTRSGGRASAPKAGSKSPKHRGFRPDSNGGAEAAAPKRRWSADERVNRGRAAERPRGGDARRESAADSRPNWEPRQKSSAPRKPWENDRRPAQDRNDRRPERGGRFERDARPERGFREDRGARPERSFRDDRPQRSDRGAREVRPERGFNDDRAERPASSNRDDRAMGPFRNERDGRDERSSRNDRDDRAARPARDDRETRAERGFRDRDTRPGRDARPERGFRSDRAERPAAGRPFREARSDRSDRSDRPVRFSDDRRERGGYDRADRPVERRESNFYPSKDAQHFTPEDDVVLERLEAQAVEASDVDGVTFADLGLGSNITRVLGELGAQSPFPIQAATIPQVLAGRDVLGRGRTGSGKTIAFGAPLVEKLMENGGGLKRRPGRNPRALILAPTRELALQIDRTVQPIARSVGLFTTQIYGGVPQQRQVMALQRGVDIIIGTPGRIEDLIEQGRLDLSEVVVTVLDEADHMADLGFLEPVQRILRQTAPHGQRLLFSATLDARVAALVEEFLNDPSVHEVAGEDQASSTIDHRVLLIDQREKAAIIERLASGEGKTLVFARTRAFAEQLADMLEDANIPAVSLHGDLNQARRTRNLEKLTSGRVHVLVATDVAARGIHVDDISLVIQADAPDEYKTYLHRAGRTGRAGKAGTVVTLVPRNRRRRLEELLGRAEIEASWTPVALGDDVLSELAAI
jgi:superfamily II DNA/RNA helicase